MKKRALSYLALSVLVTTTFLTLSAFEEIDQADDTGIAGKCYNVTYYDCGNGTHFGSTCTFTGIYGSPYSCTSSPCTTLPGPPPQPTTRRCVKKVPPPPAPPM